MSYDVRQYGAIADGETPATQHIQAALDVATAAGGGGTVVIPAGRFVTGTIWLRSNTTLHLEPGAVLLGSQPNTDGFNPESCRNVCISDCHVDVGDDCITIKSGKEDDGRREHLP